jgi:hypothetical protein
LNSIPAINIIHDFFALCWAVCCKHVLPDPLHKMVFESPFDDLMEKIRRDQLVDIGAWEVIGEGLHER